MHSKPQDNSALLDEKGALFVECRQLLNIIANSPLANRHLKTVRNCLQLCLNYKANRRADIN